MVIIIRYTVSWNCSYLTSTFVVNNLFSRYIRKTTFPKVISSLDTDQVAKTGLVLKQVKYLYAVHYPLVLFLTVTFIRATHVQMFFYRLLLL